MMDIRRRCIIDQYANIIRRSGQGPISKYIKRYYVLCFRASRRVREGSFMFVSFNLCFRLSAPINDVTVSVTTMNIKTWDCTLQYHLFGHGCLNWRDMHCHLVRRWVGPEIYTEAVIIFPQSVFQIGMQRTKVSHENRRGFSKNDRFIISNVSNCFESRQIPRDLNRKLAF